MISVSFIITFLHEKSRAHHGESGSDFRREEP